MTNIYTVEVDGVQYDIEGDRPPTEAEARAAIAASQKQATPPPPSATIGMKAQSTFAGDPAPSEFTSIDAMIAPGGPLEDYKGLVQGARYGAFGSPLVPAAAKATPGIIARGLGISKERAGERINAGVQAAKNTPINVEAPGKIGAEMLDFQGIETIPRVAQSFMRRITDPSKPDLTVEEAQRYMSSISRLSTGEFGKLTPNMQRQVAAMSQALRESLVDATGGYGGQYAKGVREYARSAKAAKYGKKAVGIGLGATGGALSANYILNRITDALRSNQ